MNTWLTLLAGPMVWALHFSAVYAIASLSLQLSGEMTSVARMASIVASVACVALAIIILLCIRRPRDQASASFRTTVARAGLIVAGIAIAWQTLPVVLVLPQ